MSGEENVLQVVGAMICDNQTFDADQVVGFIAELIQFGFLVPVLDELRGDLFPNAIFKDEAVFTSVEVAGTAKYLLWRLGSRLVEVFSKCLLDHSARWVPRMVGEVKESAKVVIREWFVPRPYIKYDFWFLGDREPKESFFKSTKEPVVRISASKKAGKEERQVAPLVGTVRDQAKDARNTRDDHAGADSRCVGRDPGDVEMKIQRLLIEGG